MAKVISLLSQKGGPGKTTLTILSATFLHCWNTNVSVIDADYPQHSFSRTRKKDLDELEYRKQLAEKKNSKKEKHKEELVLENAGASYTIESSTNSEETETIQETNNVETSDKTLNDQSELELYPVIESTIRESISLIKKLRRSDSDFVFVDVPGTLNVDGMELLIEDVDLIIIPIELEFKSITAATETMGVVRNICKETHIAIVWTKVKKNHKVAEREAYEIYFKEHFSPYIFKYILFETVRIGQVINTITPMPSVIQGFVIELGDLLNDLENSPANPS